ncbi:DNA cytosine methyltransferase [Opitutia bacterium ISCC 51]|nr:DNA cytosine methyltransferase [Opitutae bacterium ISCC 51]QXD29451.1 DNA cytosine methyltransferase [Opitutae bacterium ISCC 52]
MIAHSTAKNKISEGTPYAKTMRVNGKVTFQAPSKGSLIINFKEALSLILATESATEFDIHVREELPAIVSHWLQNPKETPVLLDMSYRDKWLSVVRSHCELKVITFGFNMPKERKHPRPIHIDFSDLPFPPVAKPKFTFIDLFAGIGGFRIALQGLGGKCLFSSEWDRHAKETYFQNYGEVPFGDITKLSEKKLIENPVDILAGGFPCQPFSRAGVSARSSLGQEHGFSCETQGQLFFDVISMAKIHKPKILLLENVGNLLRHDGGHTFATIKDRIENDLGYHFFSSVYNTNVLVPQSRVRCIIVAFREKPPANWEMPTLQGEPLALGTILEDLHYDSKYTLSKKMWDGHIRRSKRNVDRGAGFTAYPKDLSKPSTTLVARYYKDGKECLIPQENHPDRIPRMLTQRECARLQGFPEEFEYHRSKVAAYKQFGNAVPVPLVSEVAKAVLPRL